MRVPARLDGSALLLWIAVAVLATGLTWWDAQDSLPGFVPDDESAVVDVEVRDEVPATGDVVWMDVEEVEEAYGLRPSDGDQEPGNRHE